MSTATDLAASGYRLGDVVGAGGGGQVYRAWLADGTAVAVKVAHASDDVTAARTAREVAIASRLPRACFPRIHGSGRLDDGRAWLAMEWIEGGTLGARLGDRPWAAADAIAIGLAVARALAAAHAAGVVHRDVKPDNVMFRADGACVLVDLGLARGVDDPATSATRCAGTPSYMAPEQVLGEAIDARTDLYALGGILYRLVAGRDAFTGGALEIQLAHLGQDPAPLPAPATARDAALHALIGQLLAKRPADRPASADEVVARLARLTPARRLARIARASAASGLALLVVATAAAAAIAAHGRGAVASAMPAVSVATPAPVVAPPDADAPWAMISAGDYTLRARWSAAAHAGGRLAVTVEVWGQDEAPLPASALAATLRDPAGHTIALTGRALRSLALRADRPGEYVLTVFAPEGDIELAVPIAVGAAPTS